MARFAISVALLLAGCGATLRGETWDNKNLECDKQDTGGGQWPHEFCRGGRGVLVRAESAW